MTRVEQRYLIKERSTNDVKKYGSVQNAITFLKKELEEMENLWGKYSSECLGHGITGTRLKINYLTNQELNYQP